MSAQQVEHARHLARDKKLSPADIATQMNVGRTTIFRSLKRPTHGTEI